MLPFNPTSTVWLTLGLLTVGLLASCSDSPTAGDAAASASGAASAAAAGSATAGLRSDLAREGSAVGLSADGRFALVAAEDQTALYVVSLPLGLDSKKTTLSLPGRPAQLIVQDNTILVTIRELTNEGGGALLFLTLSETGEAQESGRVKLPPDAWGIATSPSGTHALVTSAFSSQLSRVDLQKRTLLWSKNVGREPRGVAFGKTDELAYVAHLVGSQLTTVTGSITDPQISAQPFPAAPQRAAVKEGLDASLGYALVLSPDRERLFAPRHALGALGLGEWSGGATVDVWLTGANRPLLSLRERAIRKVRHPQVEEFFWSFSNTPVPTTSRQPIQPRAALYRPSTKTLLVASEGTDRIFEFDALVADPSLGAIAGYDLSLRSDRYHGVAEVGGAPSGLALSTDERSLYVYCRSTDELALQPLVPGPGYQAAPPQFVKLADDLANEDLRLGRRLFYNASDHITSGGLGCAGCHPDGREDGYVWHEVTFGKKADRGFTNFVASASAARLLVELGGEHLPSPHDVRPEGAGVPRQTPMLVGRVNAKGPYGWRAESETLVHRIRDGFDLHRWQNGSDQNMLANLRATKLAVFLREGLVAPPREKRDLSAEEKRGQALFASEATQCSSCHTPETDYTNRSIAAFPAPRRAAFVEERGAAFKTPSLLFVAASPPYFHDGRYATLEEVIEKNGDMMGRTSHLSAEDKKALVAYLRTL